MFIVSGRNKNYYDIFDTSDSTTESISEESIRVVLKSGVEILGVNEFGLDNNYNVKVFLRLHDRSTGNLFDYDGYVLTDALSDLDSYTSQVVGIDDLYDFLKNKDCLDVFCRILRNINKDRYAVISDFDKFGYTYIEKFGNDFRIKRLDTDEIYTCDFFDCVYIRYVDRVKIDGISVTKDVVEADGFVITHEEALYSYVLSSNDVIEDYPYELEINTVAESSYNDLYDSFIVLSSRYVPIYALGTYTVQNECDSNISYWWKHGKVLGVDILGNVAYEDGYTCKAQDVYYSYKLLNSDLYDDFDKYYRSQYAKEALIGIKGDWHSYTPLCVTLDKVNMIGGLSGYKSGRNNIKKRCMMTFFGNIEVHDISWDELDIDFDSIFLARITHLGTVVFNTYSSIVNFGTSEVASDSLAYMKNNNNWEIFLETCKERNLFYHNNTILPLCFTQAMVNQKGICIYVVCLVSDSKDGFGTSGFTVIRLPIHMTAGNFQEYNDCFIYHAALQDIILDKNVVNNLYAKIGSFEVCECLFVPVRSKARKVDELMNKWLRSTFEGVLEDMSLL